MLCRKEGLKGDQLVGCLVGPSILIVWQLPCSIFINAFVIGLGTPIDCELKLV